MQIIKQRLMDILNDLRPGLAKKDVIEQATHFLFTGEEIVSYNDRICIMYPFETDFICSVKGEELYKIISGAYGEFLEVNLKKDQLRIAGTKTNAGLSILVAEPRVEHIIETMKKEAKIVKWMKLPENFTKGAFLCMFSTARDLTRGILTCVHFDKDLIISTDGLRASKYVLDKKIKPFDLPSKDVMELVKFQVTQYALTEGWAYFKTDDDILFAGRTFTGDYPTQLKDKFDFKGDKTIILPIELKKAIEMVGVLAEGDIDINKIIEVDIKEGEITIRAEKEVGWADQSLEIEYKGDPITFYINPIFFSQILDKSVNMIIKGNQALFVTEDFQHIISLPIEEK